jgi:thiosulfate reductase cytochrome b subunit
VRHSVLVRVTHWLTAASFVALAVSGVAILLAHPRLYWGETGALGAQSIVDLPLPMILTGQSGWGRYLHFLAAWICVLTAFAYIPEGTRRGHFAKYTTAQRTAYRIVVFVLFPLMIWTGFAMSPAITSVFPLIVTVFGGQQSARTIHFVAASLLLAFAIGHVIMVSTTGFRQHVGAMIAGRT